MTDQVRHNPERSELPAAMTWDLIPLYADLESWERDFAALDGLAQAFSACQDGLGSSPESVVQAFERLDSLNRACSKLHVHAHLRSDEDTADSTARARLERASAKFAEISGLTSWFSPALLALPPATVKCFLESPALAYYRRALEEIERSRPHTLSAPEERLLGLASDALSTPYNVFGAFDNADLRFPVLDDGKGGKAELTHGNYIEFLKSSDRDVRRSAYEAYRDNFVKWRNTLAATLGGGVKANVFEAKARNFASAREAALHPDNVPVAVYDKLVAAVRSKLPALHRYLELRRRALKLDVIRMHDLHVPLVPDYNLEVTWEQAKAWVLESLQPLGEEYCQTARRAFSERWVDALECRGKRSGAYSSGCYDSSPYILMNFKGTLNCVFTLAHELGHSMHSLLSNRSQGYQYARYKIFVAEVASTTNELLLAQHLRQRSDDPRLSTYLLNHQADQVRTTIIRQTMFAEFERDIHAVLERGQALTADGLSESYAALNDLYHRGPVETDSRAAIEWAGIPHFYYGFYVYKYATGLSAAMALAKGLLDGRPDRSAAYLRFLAAGCSKDPLDLLQDAGVDLGSGAPVATALEEFSRIVAELESRLP